jgi:uncharacterized coiled-coil protein SlyX
MRPIPPFTDPFLFIMDEIKNTTEVEVNNVQPTEAEATVCNEAMPAEAKQNEKAEPTTKAEVIEALKDIVYNGGDVERATLEHLKMLYYRIHNAEVVAARDKFVGDGGNAEDFIPAPDADEENFKAQLALIREMRSKAAEELEKEKQDNLQRKLEIIDRIKELAATAEEADKGFEEVKKLQAEWKEIKTVPAERATELWKNYQLYTEQFYDQLHLNHEMRAYDFRKNLEIKTHLCEAAEKLAEVEDVISAFHQLQKLHQEFREAGPVAKELRDEIWKRFKDASTVINKRHQDHFEGLKAREEENLQKKTALCEKVEQLQLDDLKTYAQWDEMSKQIIELQAEWKTIGFTPRKVNNEIFDRFRAACDRFFQAKTAYFKANREKLSANLAAKNALIEKAEALKDSTDWGATTNKFVELQKEWKTIGPVAHKISDTIWKRFNDACNYFFDKKNEANKGQRKEEEANLELKKAVIAEIEKLAAEPGDNLLQSIRELQAKWNEIGHVPFSKKEKMYRRYRELCDKVYDTLHATAGKRRMDNFKRNVAEKGGNELTRERNRLQNVLDAKKQDIQNYETNLTFFRSSSKKGNSIVADIEKKIERLKDDLKEITEKLKTVNEQIKAEEKK